MRTEFISNYNDDDILYNHVVMRSDVSEYSFDMHTHDICELIYLKKGNTSCIIGGKTYKIFKDCLVIFRPHIPHRVIINDSSDYERYNILFDEKVLANRVYERLPDDLDVINYSGNNYISDLFKKMDFYYSNFEGEDLKLLIRHIIEELIFNITLAPEKRLNEGLMSVNPVMNKAVEYIDKYYANPLSVSDICKNLYITKSHLHHLFSEYMQTSPKKYINAKRLAMGRELIRTGKKPTEVYLNCGFSDYATFFRNYKSMFGHSPSEETETEIKRKIES